MEKLVADLKQRVPLKDTTDVGDLILVAGENPSMLFYALVTEIQRDSSRRDEWWHVSFTCLTVPLQPLTWTLRRPQFTGQEIFTMGGAPRFVQAVALPGPAETDGQGSGMGPSLGRQEHAGLRRIK